MAMAAAAGEDAASLLSRAVHAVFAEWTALGMAVENEWGGRATRDKALQLLHRVLTGLLSSSAVHVEELEELLDSVRALARGRTSAERFKFSPLSPCSGSSQALLDDFNVEAEDDSPAQVARLLCTLHSEVCGEGWGLRGQAVRHDRATLTAVQSSSAGSCGMLDNSTWDSGALQICLYSGRPMATLSSAK
eukprot:scaffold9181_cov37-Tisochrysis_lutea.AAC.4